MPKTILQGKEITWVMIETHEELVEHFRGDVVLDIHTEPYEHDCRVKRYHDKKGKSRYFNSKDYLEFSKHVIFKFVSGKYIMFESLEWNGEGQMEPDLECPNCEHGFSEELSYETSGTVMFAYLAVPIEEEF